MRTLLATIVVVWACQGASAQPKPSFNCAKASTTVEKAICRDVGLAELDRAVAEAYAGAAKRMDAPGRKVLKADQEAFLNTREEVLESKEMSLSAVLKERAETLRKITAGLPGNREDAYLGEWSGTFGGVTIKPGKSGMLAISIQTAQPVTGRWVCEVEGEARLGPAGLSFMEENVRINVRREGAILQINAEREPGAGGLPFCGMGGFISGGYLKVE